MHQHMPYYPSKTIVRTFTKILAVQSPSVYYLSIKGFCCNNMVTLMLAISIDISLSFVSYMMPRRYQLFHIPNFSYVPDLERNV